MSNSNAGIRTEQLNVEDALRYFVGRHEFTEDTILELIRKLTESDLSGLGFITRIELQNIIDKFYNDLNSMLDQVNVDINNELLLVNSYFTNNFLAEYGFRRVLEGRGIEIPSNAKAAELKRLVIASNPETELENDENLSPFIKYTENFLLEYGFKKILAKREMLIDDGRDIYELARNVKTTNPFQISNIIEIDDYLLLPDAAYTSDYLMKYAVKEVLHVKEVAFTADETFSQLYTKVINGRPAYPIAVDTYPFEKWNDYSEKYLKEFAFHVVLKRRGIEYDKATITFEDLVRLVEESNPEIKVSMTINEIIQAINGDKDFYVTITNRIQNFYDELLKLFNDNNVKVNKEITDIKNALNGSTGSINSQIESIKNTLETKLDKVEVTTSATANKVLRLDATGKLPTSVTGDAGSVNGRTVNDSATNTNTLWTSNKIQTQLNTKSNNHDHPYSPLGHVHDERYYTEAEVNNLLNNKSNNGHVHDERYYTEAEMNSLLNNKFDKTGGSITGTTTTREINITYGYALKHNGVAIVGTDGKVWRAVWNDLAEFFLSNDYTLSPGDVVVWCGTGVKKSTKANDGRVVGVYSDTFGICMGGDDNVERLEDNIGKYVPVGLAGRVYVNAVGPIKEGDFLVSSNIAGTAKKKQFNSKQEAILGKALEPLKKGEQKRILMLIK